MDRARYSAIAHATLPFAAPVSEGTFDALVAEVPLPSGAAVLDLGCGKAELSARFVERWGAHAVGIDRAAPALAVARARAARLARGRLDVIEGDLAGPLPDGPWDLVLNVGAMPAGTQSEALRGWAAALGPKGHLLIGDGYWKRPPAAEYLAALGGSADDLRDLAGTLARATEAGLVGTHVHVSPDADFEAYELAYRDNVLRWVAEHPDDPDAGAMLARARGWWQVYERWGRDTLGFVVTVLERA